MCQISMHLGHVINTKWGVLLLSMSFFHGFAVLLYTVFIFVNYHFKCLSLHEEVFNFFEIFALLLL